MAKSGTITGGGSNADLVEEVSQSEAPIMTIGQLVAAILAASPIPRLLEVDLGGRTVSAFASAAQADEDGTSLVNFGMDDDTKKVAPWTGNDGDAPPDAPLQTAIKNVANAAAKPSRSLAGLINALDDLAATQPNLQKIIIDQVGAEVRAGSDLTFGGPTVADAVFTQTVTEDTGTPGFAFE